MMQERSRKELEALSAYLDRELPGKQRAKLTARLQKDAELRLALESLRQTRALLRSAPQMKAPRNFTLTPEMVGAGIRAKPRRLYSAMQLVTVMATVLFVVVVAGDLLANGGLPTTFMIGGQADEAAISENTSGEDVMEMAAEAVPEAEMAEQEGDLDMADMEAEAAFDTASEPPVGAIGTGTLEVKSTVAEETEGDSEAAGADMDDAVEGESERITTEDSTVEPTLLFAAQVRTATIEMATEVDGQGRAMTSPEIAEVDGQDIGMEESGLVEEARRQLDIALITLRLIEIGLAVVAVAAGVIVVVMRRKGKAN